MALKIVTGGTTGAADGTLVSSGNPLVIVALNTAVNAHIRCDDGYWSSDQHFDVPAELEVSFDGGSTWYDNADEPITAPEIYAVNVPIKIRQTVAAGSASGSFVTDGTYTAIAALSTPTLTATVISDTQIDLSWTNVSNEDASPGYTIERSPNGSSSWSALTTKAQNVTTHSDTGLTASTRYYYRVKAEGSGRYSDSGWGTDDDTTTAAPTTVTFNPSSDGAVRNYNAGSATWATIRAGASGDGAYPSFDYCTGGYSVNPASTGRQIQRTHMHFNTASLPDGATIVAARLKLWGHETYTKASMSSATAIVLLESLMTAGMPVATGDYPLASFGTTELTDTRKTHSAWSDGAYNVITLNAAGRALISKTGTTRLAMREASDVDNSAPGDTTERGLYFYTQDYATSGKRPVLEVDYV